MAAAKARDSGLERRWRERMAQFARSGLSIRAFCARHRISEPSFYAWRRELAERDRDAANAAPTFVPVTVVPSAAIEVSLPGGVTVRVPAGSDEVLAVRLVAALAAAARAASC
jgi:transposase-like protein